MKRNILLEWFLAFVLETIDIAPQQDGFVPEQRKGKVRDAGRQRQAHSTSSLNSSCLMLLSNTFARNSYLILPALSRENAGATLDKCAVIMT